jgi:Zn-finger nucleic acid-binding protein
MTPHCPHDLNPLSVREAEGHVGFLCETCQGAWLPRSYLQSIEHGRHFSHERLFQMLGDQRTAASFLQCPSHCGSMQISRIKGIALDWCPECRGIWFDQGEIAMLLSHYRNKSESLPDGERVDGWDIADIALSLLDLLQ